VQEIVSYIPLGGAHRVVLMHVMLVMGGHFVLIMELVLRPAGPIKKHIFSDITFATFCHLYLSLM
jgi:hypothetical protein